MVFNRRAYKLICASKINQNIIAHDWWCYQLISGAGGEVIFDKNNSKIKFGVCKVLESEGYISKADLEGEGPKKAITLTLKYFEDKPVIKEFNRSSKPGLRKYFSSNKIPTVRGGLGTAIMTTSKGIITGKQAEESKVGGELICTVF